MSTNITATLPNVAFSSDAVTGPLPAAPTMPIGALAWSAEEPVDQPRTPAPVISTRKPRPTRTTRAAFAAMLFGAVTVGAALGAVALGGNDSPSTPPAVVDRTESAPSIPPVPAPTPTVSQAVVPAGAAEVTIPAVALPKIVVPTHQVALPPYSAPDTSTIVGYPEYNGGDPAKPTEHHDWDHHDRDHHDRDHQDHQDQKH
jgi:hypothetical protein